MTRKLMMMKGTSELLKTRLSLQKWSDEDSEDDEAELLRELEKIKRERAEEKARKVL